MASHDPQSDETLEMHESLAAYSKADITLVTIRTFGRQPLVIDSVAHTWTDILRRSQRRQAWQLLGHVCLPDHAHLVVVTPIHLTLDQLVHGAVTVFGGAYRQLMGMPETEPVWQRSYSRRRAQNATDHARFLDYVHYNPVQHGIVERPEAWAHSSYQDWVGRRLYRLGWGWTQPESIRGKRWE